MTRVCVENILVEKKVSKKVRFIFDTLPLANNIAHVRLKTGRFVFLEIMKM